MHGFTSNAENIQEYSKFNDLAEKNGFAIVYPQGTMDKDSNTFWNVGYTFHEESKVNDVDFIYKLVKELQKKHSLSTTNTFLAGMSNGGEMCYLLACKHPELFGAVAPVAGMMLKSFFDDCSCNEIPPIFAIFGTADDVTNFNGDIKNKDGWGAYISIPAAIEFWAKNIKYNKLIIDTLPDINQEDSSYIECKKFINTNNHNQVKFYKVIGGGHDWPGSSGNKDVFISDDIWNFFEQYIQ